jgi:hypothetical protein
MNSTITIVRNTLFSVNALWGRKSGLICLRQTGLDHIKKSAPCDDFGVILLDPETDIRFMVLSDGMGSYENSRFSSRNYCINAAINPLTKDLFNPKRKRGFLQDSLRHITYNAALENQEYCENHFDVEPLKMAATLQMAIGKDDFIDVLNIGDGGGYVALPGLKFITPVATKQSASTVGGCVIILRSEEWEEDPRYVKQYSAKGEAIVLATDGHADRFPELIKQAPYVESCADLVLAKCKRLVNDSLTTILPNAYAILSGMSALSKEDGRLVVGKKKTLVQCDDATIACSKELKDSELNEPLAAFQYESNSAFSMCSMTTKQSNSFARGVIIEDDGYQSLLLHVTLTMKENVSNPGLFGQIKSFFFLNLLEQHLVRSVRFEDDLVACTHAIRIALRGIRGIDALNIVVSCKNGETYFATFGKNSSTISVKAIGTLGESATVNDCWGKIATLDVIVATHGVSLDPAVLKSSVNRVHKIVHGNTVDECELQGVRSALEIRGDIGSGSVTFLRNMWRVGATKENAAVVPSVKHESNQGTSDSKEVVAPRPVASTPSVVPIPEVISQKPKSTRAERDAERARLRNYSKFPKRKILDDLYGVPDDEDTCTVDGIGVVMWQDAKLGRIESIRDVVTRQMVDTVLLPDGKSFKLQLVSERWQLHLWKLSD